MSIRIGGRGPGARTERGEAPSAATKALEAPARANEDDLTLGSVCVSVSSGPIVPELGVPEAALRFPHLLVPPPRIEHLDIEVRIPFESIVPAAQREQLERAVSIEPRGAFRGKSHALERTPEGFVLRVEDGWPSGWVSACPLLDVQPQDGPPFTVALFSPEYLHRETRAKTEKDLASARRWAELAEQQVSKYSLYLEHPVFALSDPGDLYTLPAAFRALSHTLAARRPSIMEWFKADSTVRRAVLHTLAGLPRVDPAVRQQLQALVELRDTDADGHIEGLERCGMLGSALGLAITELPPRDGGGFEVASGVEAEMAEALEAVRPRWTEQLEAFRSQLPRLHEQIRQLERRLEPDHHERRPTSHRPYRREVGPAPLSLFGASSTPNSMTFHPEAFERARDPLMRWSETAGYEPRGLDGLRDIADEVFMRRLDLTSKEGPLALDALQEAGFFGMFNRALLELLVDRYGTDALEGIRVLYNGHATQAMFPVKSSLEALGAKGVSMSFNPSSGTDVMDMLFALQLVLGGDGVRSKLGAEPRQAVKEHELKMLGMLKKEADAAEEKGETLIVDKGGIVAKYLDDDLERQLHNGTLRFVSHNRDDIEALSALSASAVIADLARSRIKEHEAKILGEQYTLLGAKEARERWDGAKLRDLPIYIVGAGLMGGELMKAMERLGLSPERICIVDPNEEVRRKAQAQGFQTLAEPPSGKERPERSVVYVATPDRFLDEKTIHRFGKDTVFLPISSGGKAVDAQALKSDRRTDITGVPRSRGMGNVPASDSSAAHLMDWEIRAEGAPDGETTRAVIPVEGFPLNLYQESWADRFAITAAGILVAVLEAARHERPRDDSAPGKTREHPLPFDIEQAILDLYDAFGLNEPRPLDARADSPEERAALLQDLLDLRAEG